MSGVGRWVGNAVAALLTLVVVGCGRERAEVHFVRVEQTIFETDEADLADALRENRDLTDTPLLNIEPDDSTSMQMMQAFVADPAMRYIYGVCDSMYRDLSWLEQDLGEALARVPWMHYDRFFTLVTGDFEDYQYRVFCTDRELAVSLDHYAVEHFGGAVPAYIRRVSSKEYIAPDCMAAIAKAHSVVPNREMTLLDYAIAEGKAIYFVEQTMPRLHDTILMRYSHEQLRWMERNVEQVWAWLLQERLLFSSDRREFHNLIDEAPKTNVFGEGSAPRTTAYIGWQIVKAYMKRSGDTMEQLLQNSDSKEILNRSGWRP